MQHGYRSVQMPVGKALKTLHKALQVHRPQRSAARFHPPPHLKRASYIGMFFLRRRPFPGCDAIGEYNKSVQMSYRGVRYVTVLSRETFVWAGPAAARLRSAPRITRSRYVG